LLSTNTKEFAMRKLTPEEKAAKKALAHTHDENCGHAEAPAVAPVAEEAPVEEAPVAEVVAETPAEEVSAEDKPKKKTAPKY
jgi:hypothetical protein